jgi:putative membrane-bound dehydrogenase-like protein
MMALRLCQRQWIAAMTALTASAIALTTAALAAPPTATTANPHWIWSPAHQHQHVPPGACYFRKRITIDAPQEGEALIACDDGYTLYVNGRRVGSGRVWKTLDRYDISPMLVPGQNVVAVKATNGSPGSAGLVAQIIIKRKGSLFVTYVTGPDWRTSLNASPNWKELTFDDQSWLPAQSFGPLGRAAPWGSLVRRAGEHGRFRVPPEFEVEWVLGGQATGSLIAMTFTEQGHIVAARDGGPLILISDKDQDGVHETITTYCDQVTNCQGLAAVGGNLMAVGDGPEGAALYRLSDNDGDDQVDTVEAIVKFKGGMAEQGPHAVALGPEGLVYLAVGNRTQLDESYAPTSPYHHYYEGDLLQPRYEDPSGQETGIKAPGGAILRTDADGSFVELVAGGLRNPYDMAFNRQGDLFTCDADMEWNVGMPWYQPTRIVHVTAGAEFGWRSGWATWPSYYVDALPATLNMGRGAPTGVKFYDHVMYPVRYQGALFTCDWARGRISAVMLTPHGSTYQAQAEVFVEGQPLHATAIAVGPDGWLYFCTGGRGTAGGIYRVVWTGHVPPEATQSGSGIAQALHQPQPQSAWARGKILALQERLGDRWDTQLLAATKNLKNSSADRARALDLMQLFGPPPSPALLQKLSHDGDTAVRAKATYLMGVQGDEQTAVRLAQLLTDPDAAVRRLACESIVRGRYRASVARLLSLFSQRDRFTAHAARRALEKLPPEAWQKKVLESDQVGVFVQGATALLVAHANADSARAIVQRATQMLAGKVEQPNLPAGFISDRDFIGLLRVVQLALSQGHLTAADVPQLRQRLAKEYPSRDAAMNRELTRLLVYLGDPSVTPRLIAQLKKGSDPQIENLHLAMVASLIERGWKSEDKLELLRFLDRAHAEKGGPGLDRYLDQATDHLADGLSESETELVLEGGADWPSAAFAVLTKMPSDPSPAALQRIERLDEQLDEIDQGPEMRRLRLGIIAVLGRSRDDQAMGYLRQAFNRDPARRQAIAMGLAQNPDGENWALLVRSLPLLDGVAAMEVLGRLAEVERTPDSPEPIRQVILCGLRTEAQGAPLAMRLLEKWTGEHFNRQDEPWDTALAKWQDWFVDNHSDQPAPRLPQDSQDNKWTYRELLSYLLSEPGTQGDAQRGAAAFHDAQCAACHQYGSEGAKLGPDLTAISRQYHKREILESILFPAHTISTQYAGKIVVTTDGHTRAGIPAQSGSAKLRLRQAGRDQIEVPVDQIEEIVPRKGSAMPDGLLNVLTLQQVADLFAFLNKPPRTMVTSRRHLGAGR